MTNVIIHIINRVLGGQMEWISKTVRLVLSERV